MKEKRKRRCRIGFLLLGGGLLALLMANLMIGSVSIPADEVAWILSGRKTDVVSHDIVMQIRFPRALAGLLGGGALALAGYLLQTFFHNPIAGPFVLGISSGAKMVVALMMVFALSFGIRITSVTMVLAAFAGSLLSMGFVLLVSRAVERMSMLIVAGVMIGYICSAVTEFVVTFADDSNIVNLHNWSQGSFSGISWEHVRVMAVVTGVCLIAAIFLSKPMGAYLLGEVYAGNMGVNIRLFRFLLVLLSSVLAACVTAFAGPVSFIGIAVPHLSKSLVQTTKPLVMVPACFLGGGIFCLFCDLLSRMMFAPTELSVSAVTAVFGAPVVICQMIKQKKERGL